MKTCTKCGVTRPLGDFHRQRGGRKAQCRDCSNADSRAYHARRGAPIRRRKRRTYLDKYGLTLDAWHAMLIAQAGRCALCSLPMWRPCVDHCHETGRIRGLLCDACNRALGKLGDTPASIARVLVYLTSPETSYTVSNPLPPHDRGDRWQQT